MDAVAGEGGEGFVNYAQIEEFFNSMALEGPSAQDRMDCIVSQIISLLPTPFVPAPDADDSSDSDDDHFSLTSSDSEDTAVAADDRPAVQDGDGQDHISHLPDDLLSNIISRLPTKEAARTMVLSTLWRGVWAAAPLLVDDAHLRTDDAHRDFNAVRAISRCVAAHPGPVCAVRFTRTSFYHQEYALERLIDSLAAKKIQDLILFNRPWPLDMPLPNNILNCASLSRLYIGVWRWRLPDTTALRPAFPNLHELGLFHSIIEDSEVDALLAHCPKLKILSFAIAYVSRSRLRIKSSSLCVVMEWGCSFDEIIVEDAPCLERLLFQSIFDRRPVKIVHAPRLEVLGYLDLQLHALEIGGIVIRAGMNARASAMLPSLKILAVKVRFSHGMEVKESVPQRGHTCHHHSLYVPEAELESSSGLELINSRNVFFFFELSIAVTLSPTNSYLSIQSTSPDGVHYAEFWKSQGSCDCLESHLKTFVLHGFQGLNCEMLFLSYILKNGKVLKTLGMVCSDSDDVVSEGGQMSCSVGEGNEPSGGSSGSDDVVVEGGPISGSAGEGNVSSGGSSGSHEVVIEGGPMSSSISEGDAPSAGSTGRNIIHVCPASPSWSFQNAIDLSVEDPFYVLRHARAWRASRVEA